MRRWLKSAGLSSKTEFLAEPVKDSWSEFLWGGYSKVRSIKNGLSSPRFYRTIGSQQYWHPERNNFTMPRRFDALHKAKDRVRASLNQYGLIAAPRVPPPAVGEVLDVSVDERVRRNPRYRPPNLKPFSIALRGGHE